MAAIARPAAPAPRRTLRSYARASSSRKVPLRATEAAGDPIDNSDEDEKPKSPIKSQMTNKDLRDICIPETPTKSEPENETHSGSMQKVPSATSTPSPELSPSPDTDVVETSGEKKSDSSDASVLDVSHRASRGTEAKEKHDFAEKHQSSPSSKVKAEAEKRVTRSRSKYGFRKASNQTQPRRSPTTHVTDDDDDDGDDDVVSSSIQLKSRKRLQKNAETSEDDVQEVETPPSKKRRRTRFSSKTSSQTGEDSADNLELQAMLSNVTDESKTTKIIMEWSTKDGRAKLRKLYGHQEDDEQNVTRPKKRVAITSEAGNPEDTETDEESQRVRKKRRKRKSTSSNTVAASDTDDKLDSGSPAAQARQNVKGVRTRHQIESMTKKERNGKNANTKSVPLPPLEDLRRQLKSRRALNSKGIENSGKPPKGERREESRSATEGLCLKLRRSKRKLVGKKVSSRSTTLDENCDKDNESEIDHDSKRGKNFKSLSDTIKQLSDAEDEIRSDEEEVEIELEEIEESAGSEDDYAEEEVVFEEDEEDDEEDQEDQDFQSEDFLNEESESKRSKSRRKANGRRKRTRPRNIFQSQADALSAREQQERLDFLVQQSASIAKDLHVAMAAQSGKHSDERKANHLGESESNVASRKEEAFVPPTGENCNLQPHQNEGVKWLLTLDAQGLNAILADEMGLGKTIQAISFLASLVISGSRGPHLVIAPRNVCAHWAEEVEKFYPGQISVVTHLGSADERFENLEQILREDAFDIMITSYELAARDIFSKKRREGYPSYSRLLRAFRNVEFEYLVVDEAHRLKNDNSKTNIGIRNYVNAQRRLLLTGTPLSNNLKELWSLMNVLNPQIFSSKATFETWFSAPFSSKIDKKNTKVDLTASEKSVIVDRLHTVIRPFFRRRVRADVCPTFTSADEVVIRCPLSALQKALMMHFQQRSITKGAGLNNVVMAMRRVSNHPYIVSPALYENYSNQVSPTIIGASGKFVFLYFALPRLLAGDHRVLIFSQFREVLDFLEDLMDLLGIKFIRLDGMTSADERSAGLAEFNREGSDTPVFLLTTRAGGVGLNLQTADTVILFDSDWNPSADLQAVSRIQRIGQKKTVHILRLVTDHSIDDLIVEAARNKMKTQRVAVGAGKFNTSHGAALDQRMRQRDLEQLLQRLELINYNEIDCGVVETDSASGRSFNSHDERSVDQLVYRKWGKALLRPGENTLPGTSVDPIWIDSVDGCRSSDIPKWLKSDADIWAAAKALSSSGPHDAIQVYEDAVKSKALIGGYSKRSRAARARRQIIKYDDYSDMESGDDEKDPELVINDEDIHGEESEGDFDDTASQEEGKEVVPIPQVALVQPSAKNAGNKLGLSVTEHIGSETLSSEMQTSNASKLSQSEGKTKVHTNIAISNAAKGNTFETLKENGSKKPRVKSINSKEKKPQGISTTPILKAKSKRLAGVPLNLPKTNPRGLGIKPKSGSGQSTLSNQGGTLSAIFANQTHKISEKSAPKFAVKTSNNVTTRTVPLSQTHRNRNAAAEDQALRYMLEYNRLRASMGLCPGVTDCRRHEQQTKVEYSKKSVPTLATPGEGSKVNGGGNVGLPIGLRRVAQPVCKNFSYSISESKDQTARLGFAGSISKASSSRTSSAPQGEREMSSMLSMNSSPNGRVHADTVEATFKSRPLLGNNDALPSSRAQVLTSQISHVSRTKSQEKPKRFQRGLPRENTSVVFRSSKETDQATAVGRGDSEPLPFRSSRKNVSSHTGVQTIISKGTLEEPTPRNHRRSRPSRKTLEQSKTKEGSLMQTSAVPVARQETMNRPAYRPTLEVVVISDSDDDFEISFSVDDEEPLQRVPSSRPAQSFPKKKK